MQPSLLDFYINNKPITLSNGEQYTLTQLLRKDDAFWEECHNFIQWMLPNPFPSQYNLDAPLLDKEFLTHIEPSDVVPVIDRFLQFLGIEYFDNRLGIGNNNRVLEWTAGNNHNKLRVTRLLVFVHCLRYYGVVSEYYVQELTKCFMYIASEVDVSKDTEYNWFVRAEQISSDWCENNA